MSAAITKITMDELNHRLEDWLCECATTEEEWDVIAEYSLHRKIKLVNKIYDGGVAQFLIDAFPEIWFNSNMNIAFAEPTRFKPEISNTEKTVATVLTLEEWANMDHFFDQDDQIVVAFKDGSFKVINP